MILLTPEQSASLKRWFQPEQPGTLFGPHILHTGQGRCYIDRWPAPRAVLAQVADNYHLSGDAQALTPAELQPLIKGFVDADESFTPVLRAAFPDLKVWQRIHFTLAGAPAPLTASGYLVRRLAPADSALMGGFNPESAWIAKTWGGPDGLAGSGYAWGAFMEGHLASLEEARMVLREEVHRYNYQQVHSTTGEVPAIRFANAKKTGNSLFRPFALPKPYQSAKDVFCLRATRTLDGYRRISLDRHLIEVSKYEYYFASTGPKAPIGLSTSS